MLHREIDFNIYHLSLFQVWIGNARGNTYSRHHISMQPEDAAFWNFSWHEIGIYDIPATIDYILEQTNQTKLSYVGHSQGENVHNIYHTDISLINSYSRQF